MRRAVYSLQSSELFLATWRAIGLKVRREKLEAALKQANQFEHAGLLLSLFGAARELNVEASKQAVQARGRATMSPLAASNLEHA